MSCKYSSAMLLLLSSCLSLCPASAQLVPNRLFAHYSNVVFANRVWVPNEPDNTQARYDLAATAATPEKDLQRPQAIMPTAQQTWNGNRNAGKAPASSQQETWNGNRNAAQAPASRQQETWNGNRNAAPAPVSNEQETWNGNRNAGPATASNQQETWNGNAGPAPAAVAASAPAPAAAAQAGAPSPAITVHGIDGAPRQAAGGPSGSTSSSGPPRPPAQFNHRERFSSLLFQPISRSNAQRNVVYSPSSVHAMLGMLYVVSSDQTADELRQAGQFGTMKQAVATDFQRMHQLQGELENAQLIVANKLYYNRDLAELNPQYADYAREYFHSEIEPVNMKQSTSTARRINAWAADATRNIIKQLVSPSDIDVQTEALLVNAIYFKARWANEFSAMDTTPGKFRVNSNAAVTVPMMFNDDVFAYADLPELDATALEMPYAGTQVSMLLLLPNQLDGLAQLERQLERNDLNTISARLRREMVAVRVPKFRIEFEQDMLGPLQELGVRRMFTSGSQVDAMLSKPVRVSKILQKAFIDVNEAGSEAAAASYAKFVPLSLPLKSREFTADHPFIFAIRTPDTVLFIGHVVQPAQLTGRQ